MSYWGMCMAEKKKTKFLDDNKVTVFLLIIALVLVSFNYLQTMNLLVKVDSLNTVPLLKGTGAITGGVGAGELTVVEFSDFQCPFCGRAAPAVRQLREKYGDKINFVYKHFPLRSIHPDAQKAAEAAECARDQGQFEAYHDALFANQNGLGIFALKEVAAELGLATVKFNNCLDSNEKADIVEKDFQEGLAKGVTGTPTFFVGDERIGGAVPFETLDAAVQRQLN